MRAMSGMVIVIGAEMNAEIEHASPWAKAPGEKVPGQKKKLGIAAAKVYRKRSTALIRLPAAALPPAPTAAFAERSSVLGKVVAPIAVWMRWRNRTRG